MQTAVQRSWLVSWEPGQSQKPGLLWHWNCAGVKHKYSLKFANMVVWFLVGLCLREPEYWQNKCMFVCWAVFGHTLSSQQLNLLELHSSVKNLYFPMWAPKHREMPTMKAISLCRWFIKCTCYNRKKGIWKSWRFHSASYRNIGTFLIWKLVRSGGMFDLHRFGNGWHPGRPAWGKEQCWAGQQVL